MENRKIFNIAHRGASDYYPENTLLSFEKAIEMGADMVELDIRLTRDKEAVVFHDKDVKYSRNEKKKISLLDLKEIESIKLNGDQNIPIFRKVVKKLKGKCKIYIDLKDEDALDRIISILREENFVSDAILGCRKPVTIKRAKSIEPKLLTSLLISLKDRKNIFDLGARAECNYLHPCWEDYCGEPSSLLDESFFKHARKGRFGIITWHEERADELRKLTKLPINGICTNVPNILSEIMKDKNI